MAGVKGRIHVDYGTFFLIDDGIPLPESYSTMSGTSGLVLTSPGSTVIFTATHTGEVLIELDVRDSAPGTVDLTSWDEAVELSLVTGDAGEMVLAAGTALTGLPGNPDLTPSGPGSYRLLVQARGRTTTSRRPGIPEEYRLHIWPAPPAPEDIHKTAEAD